MKKTFMLKELGCANCAAKMEAAIEKMEDVREVNINFMRQSLTLEGPDEHYEALLERVQKAMRRIEPDVRIVM